MKDWGKRGNRVGIFLALLFIVCFVWFWIRPVHQGLHLQMLQLWFFGYDGMNVFSFVLGLVQSYLWGYIGVGLWCLASLGCTSCCKKK